MRQVLLFSLCPNYVLSMEFLFLQKFVFHTSGNIYLLYNLLFYKLLLQHLLLLYSGVLLVLSQLLLLISYYNLCNKCLLYSLQSHILLLSHFLFQYADDLWLLPLLFWLLRILYRYRFLLPLFRTAVRLLPFLCSKYVVSLLFLFLQIFSFHISGSKYLPYSLFLYRLPLLHPLLLYSGALWPLFLFLLLISYHNLYNKCLLCSLRSHRLLLLHSLFQYADDLWLLPLLFWLLRILYRYRFLLPLFRTAVRLLPFLCSKYVVSSLFLFLQIFSFHISDNKYLPYSLFLYRLLLQHPLLLYSGALWPLSLFHLLISYHNLYNKCLLYSLRSHRLLLLHSLFRYADGLWLLPLLFLLLRILYRYRFLLPLFRTVVRLLFFLHSKHGLLHLPLSSVIKCHFQQ